jgi:hypothetical protein
VDDLSTGLPLLQLPEGFRYWSQGWTGDPMNDGMAVVHSHRVQRGMEHGLVRNHEGALSPTADGVLVAPSRRRA